MQFVDLGSPESIQNYRDSLLTSLPDTLGNLGFAEQAKALKGGDFGSFVTWFSTEVAIDGHGATENSIGLTPEQSAIFNPFAVDNRLMGPVKLWTPDDELPTGVRVGDIKVYEAFPELETLIPEAYKAHRSFVVGALFRGLVGRVDASIQLALRNENYKSGSGYEFVALSGQRAAEKGDLGGGVYKEFFGQATEIESEDLILLCDEPTMFEAIFRSRLNLNASPKQIVYDEKINTSEEFHPSLGKRTWIIKKFEGILDGKPVTLTLVNAKGVPPKGQLNRSKWGANAADALTDWISNTDSAELSQISVFNISYAHLLRIAATLHKNGQDFDSRLRGPIPVGNMPLQNTWESVSSRGHHNGSTLGFKELLSVIKSFNRLIGRDPLDLSL